jgi:D,D-heptose 1,7-bisphosphate phosphatase
MKKNKAIFLDRDGTLNKDPGYVHKIEDFEILPGVIEGLKLLQKHFLFFIISNQSGIGHGYYTIDDFHKFTNVLLNKLAEKNIKIEKIYFCPHLPEENCECRKPKTKFVNLCVDEYNIDLKSSWVIGDHLSDVLLGVNAACKTVLLLTGHGSEEFDKLKLRNIDPTIIAPDFLTAAKKIIGLI